ncbi:MAG: alanine aminotransferase, partial [Nitrosopumilaceae archaeon]
MKVSKKVIGVEYAIRDIVVIAQKLEQQGKKIQYLNIGDPAQYGFQPPDNVKDALINAIKQGENYYAPSEGILELRKEIAKKENIKGLSVGAEDIL